MGLSFDHARCAIYQCCPSQAALSSNTIHNNTRVRKPYPHKEAPVTEAATILLDLIRIWRQRLNGTWIAIPLIRQEGEPVGF